MLAGIRGILPWIIVTALSIVFIFSNKNPQMDHLRGRLTDLLATGSYPVNVLIKSTRLWGENRRLRSELAEMSVKLSQLQEFSQENERLRKMLGLKMLSPYKLLPAEVVGISPDAGVRGLLINIGSEDGVKINHAAVTPNGIVGRIYRVGKSSSSVQLITSPNIGVAARLKRSREDGIIHNSNLKNLVLNGIPISASIEIGDTVITSGLGGIFPPGLMIGITTDVIPASSGWLHEVIVSPSVDFSRLEEVFVIGVSDDGN